VENVHGESHQGGHSVDEAAAVLVHKGVGSQGRKKEGRLDMGAGRMVRRRRREKRDNFS
jgi:hypothetical protein